MRTLNFENPTNDLNVLLLSLLIKIMETTDNKDSDGLSKDKHKKNKQWEWTRHEHINTTYGISMFVLHLVIVRTG